MHKIYNITIACTHRLGNGLHHSTGDVPACIGGHGWGGSGQLSYHRLQPHAGDVSKSLRVRKHVGTEGIDDDLDLTVFNLLHQWTKAADRQTDIL